MKLNLIGYDFSPVDGYGRFASHYLRTLHRLGVDVRPILLAQLSLPSWINRLGDLDFSGVNLAFLPPFALQRVPGRLWLYSMTEGSDLPDGWAKDIYANNVERVIVPCEHNAQAFKRGGVDVPIHVVPGGTDPSEFPLLTPRTRDLYTFMCLADRGGRKGWMEVWRAFYAAFGNPEETPNVRLIVKGRASLENRLLDRISKAMNPDPRIIFWLADVPNPADIYAMTDCLVIPSRSEGWGMPHREAAMMGIPVITTMHSGLDDGHTKEWAYVIEETRTEVIPTSTHRDIAGTWEVADVNDVANLMKYCMSERTAAYKKAAEARAWLSKNQTWEHSCKILLELFKGH